MTRQPPGFVAAAFLSATPSLYAQDVVATARWYEAQLNFKVELVPPESPHTAAIVWRNEVRLTIREDAAVEPPPGPVVYIGVKGIDELYAWLRNRVNVTRPLGVEPDGTRSFEIADPNDYVLAFVEEPDAA